MTDKAYIVTNEQQEREVLEKFEEEGLVWISGREATRWIPSQNGLGIFKFPYSLVDVGYVAWRSIKQLENYEIVYDGRKEERMSEKYVVSQEFMDELKKWKLDTVCGVSVNEDDIHDLPINIYSWWYSVDDEESNNRLITILRWVNGEDVFEVDKPKKWVVRSKEHDEGGHYQYVIAGDFDMSFNEYHIEHATRFDTKKEAESWANSHQEVVEVVDV